MSQRSSKAINTDKQRCIGATCSVRCGRAALYASFTSGVLLLAGCASQGPLRPPSLKLPAPVSALTAERVGDTVELHWTTPSKTTDGVGLTGKHGAGALLAEICRTESSPAGPCVPAGRIATSAGASATFQDALPPPLRSGSLRPLHYQVRVLNSRGKGAKTVAVDALAGAVPPAVRGLAAARVTDGVALHWQADRSADGTRTLLRVDRMTAVIAPKPADGESRKMHGDLLAVEPGSHDPGGAIDTGAKPGIEQRYTVYRTQTVKQGAKDLTASSVPVTVTVSAASKAPPPSAPLGLEGLVNTLGAPEIDLVWQPAEGAAGYLVFRAEAGGAPQPLTAQPVPGLSYADSAIRAGVRYRYSVASVDANGASGSRSAEVVETLSQP